MLYAINPFQISDTNTILDLSNTFVNIVNEAHGCFHVHLEKKVYFSANFLSVAEPRLDVFVFSLI